MAGYTDTYYSRTLNESRARPVLAGNAEADVCIIGGGVAGLHTALSLAERGKRVILLEGRRIGFGASGRNGGKVLTGYAASFEKIKKRVGPIHAKALNDLTIDSLALVRNRIKKFDIDCDMADGVLIASWYDDSDSLRDDIDFEVNELGLRVEFWNRDRLRETLRSDRYYDGLFYPDYFHIHPLNYLLGIAAAFEKQGGMVFENTMALAVEESGTGLTVKTAKGAVRVRDVVYCTSCYSNGIARPLEQASVPVSSYMAVTESLPKEKLESAIRGHYGVYDTRWALDYYRVLPDNRILWGGGVGIGSHALPGNISERMLSSMLKVYPQLEGVKIENTWVGTMSSTVHRMPHIGRFSPHVWFNTNYGNNGLGPSAAGGEAIAAGIAGENDAYKLYEPFGLEYAGGILGPYVAQGIYRYWQLKDRFTQWRHEQARSAA